ncbi:MAG: DUF6516 family protein, partial [Burkholderiales bacterium]|nr:DUF6516 family protein [Burkholderiales bacterium]
RYRDRLRFTWSIPAAYGILSHMAASARRAVLVLHEKIVRDDGSIVELVVWQLPSATPDRPHALKYRLYFGRGGKCLVRYDNESGKGDHRHIRGKETPYRFVSLAKLRRDFESDMRKYGGEDEKEDSGIGR